MLDTDTIVKRYTAAAKPGERFVTANFTGGTPEMGRFLNHMPANWKLVNVQLVTNGFGSPAALFEITPANPELATSRDSSSELTAG